MADWVCGLSSTAQRYQCSVRLSHEGPWPQALLSDTSVSEAYGRNTVTAGTSSAPSRAGQRQRPSPTSRDPRALPPIMTYCRRPRMRLRRKNRPPVISSNGMQ